MGADWVQGRVPLAGLQQSDPARWGTPTETAPLAVEVTLAADGVMGRTEFWGDPIHAVKVTYQAHRGHHAQTGEPITIVSVTAFSSAHSNKSWFDPRHFVAPGLDAGTPPGWVPDAPAWFWAAVEDLSRATSATDMHEIATKE